MRGILLSSFLGLVVSSCASDPQAPVAIQTKLNLKQPEWGCEPAPSLSPLLHVRPDFKKGAARVRFVLSPLGFVRAVQIAESSGIPEYDAWALHTVQQWKCASTGRLGDITVTMPLAAEMEPRRSMGGAIMRVP